MFDLKILEKNVTYNACQEVSQLCAPLFRNFSINHVEIFRVYRDGSYYGLTSDSAWSKQFYRQQYPGPGYTGLGFSSGLYLGHVEEQMKIINPSDECYQDMLSFGLHNSAWIIDKQQGYYELYAFAAPESCRDMNYFYINHLDVLERFIDYFKTEGSDLIVKAEQDRVKVPPRYDHSFSADVDYGFDVAKSRKLFLKDITGSKEYQTLSKRELQCLQQLKLAKSAKEIAHTLQLSPRTVESYLNNAKNKLGCSKRSELMALAEDLDLLA